MTYFDYKFLHILLAFSYLYLLVAACYNPKVKFYKLAVGFISLILFISGIMAMGSLSIPHTGPFPVWVWAKISVWLILSIAPPIIIRRTPHLAKYACVVFFLLILFAAFMGVYKIS
jgi:hypothetical protein